MDIKNLTIEEASKKMEAGELTSVQLVSACIENAKKDNGDINAFLEIFDDALAQAEMADKMRAEGKATALTGIPFAIKDNILIKGHIASAASKILANYVASYDAHVIEKLQQAGAVIVGRTNMDEFAMGSSTENSAYGVTKNPLDTSRVAGGSSGGSAAAVAAGFALGALGTDTGGSIRQPAAFCGTVGLKPTYGDVSRYGAMPMGNSLDQIGPIAKTVADAKIIYETIAGHDPRDNTSVPDQFKEQTKKSNGKKIGVPWHLIEVDGIEAETLARFKETIEKLKSEGYTIVDISLPLTKYSLAVYYILMPAEVSTNLDRFDGIRYGHRTKDAETLYDVYAKSRGEGFGKETRRRIILGTYVLSHGYYDAYYRKAVAVRHEIEKEFKDAFTKCDVIAMPTNPAPAFKIGSKGSDPLAMYLADVFTVPADISGVPAITIPNGTNKEGLPLDIQFMSTWFDEQSLFAIGEVVEKLR